MRFIFFILILFTLSGCRANEQIIIENDNVDLFIGEVYELDLKFSSNKKYQEKDIVVATNIDDKDILLIDGTTVIAQKEGTCEIEIHLKNKPNVRAQMTINVMNSLELKSKNGLNILYVGKTIELEAIDHADKDNLGVTWSVDKNLLAIVVDGVVKGYNPGTITVTATSRTNNVSKSIELTIIEEIPEEVVIENYINKIEIGEEIQMKAKILPENAIQDVLWESSNPTVARIDNDGNLLGIKSGVVTIYAKARKDKKITTSFDVEVVVNPIKIFESLHVERPFARNVTTYGYNPDTREQMVYGSVSLFFNDLLNSVEKIVPINQNEYTGLKANREMLKVAEGFKKIRTGILHEETKYITYHDTGNHTPGANALMHANYMESTYNVNDRARSWHYTVDDKSVYHHIPDNEVAWQGDSYEAYAMSIGIETCVDFGSDLYATWQRTAKLIANLLVKHNLPLESIKQHYDFSGKNCPQTLRRNGLYQHAIKLVEAEYLVLTELKDYEISFTSLDKEFVDNRGRVIKLPFVETKVGYIVTIKNNEGYNKSITLYSYLPARSS